MAVSQGALPSDGLAVGERREDGLLEFQDALLEVLDSLEDLPAAMEQFLVLLLLDVGFGRRVLERQAIPSCWRLPASRISGAA